MSRWALAVLWSHVAAQAVGGGLGFALAPEMVFPAAETDALARLCLRLAAWSNLGTALFSSVVLIRVRDPWVLRGFAAMGCGYHLLAGAESVRLAAGWSVLEGSSPGFAVAHGAHAVALLAVIGLGVPRSVR